MNADTPNSGTEIAGEEPPQEVANAWLFVVGNTALIQPFRACIAQSGAMCCGIREGDALLLVESTGDDARLIAIARVYRKRSSDSTTTFYFDGVVPIEPAVDVRQLGLTPPSESGSIARTDRPVFEKVLKTAAGLEWAAFPVIAGDTREAQTYVRELLQVAMKDDLLGPADGPEEEIIGMSVRDRYLVGKMAPQNTRIVEEDNLPGASGDGESEERAREVDASTNQSLVPSSFGFTFCVDEEIDDIELQASWGRYTRTESEKINEKTEKPFRCWKRVPSGGVNTIALASQVIKPFAPDPESPDVLIQGSVSRPLSGGERLVTLFLVNGQQMPDQNQDEAWVFQPELLVRDTEGRPIFRRRPVLNSDEFDEEREALEMIYRQRVEFAVGHGISVHATVSEDDAQRAVEVKTVSIPEYEVAVTETPGLERDDRPALQRMIDEGFLDMQRLAEMDRPELVSALRVLTEDYGAWIDEQRLRIGAEVRDYDKASSAAMDTCASILERLEEGIGVLESDDNALEAFRFANRAMAAQRVRSMYALAKRRGESPDLPSLDIPRNRSWRPFQLAFVLLSVPALANPRHRDRTKPLEAFADLLWFPTGGGKTEAYLGVAAFTMGIRRLQGNLGGFDASRGLAVIMRYTLRLLTIQQFQRAATLICAMEAIRRQGTKTWGETPFTIGLWVGQRVTPNSTKESHEAIERERDGQFSIGSTPAQLTSCPWCGCGIAPGRDIVVNRDIGRTFIYCGDKLGKCEFSRNHSRDLGIPVLVVDDEIYHRPPSMLIATVDKFAMMAWRGQVRTLFGRATEECDRHGLIWPGDECSGTHRKRGALPATTVRQVRPIRPPDLIIQDEFHLISGPLGTMVGLYETAVDELSVWHLDDTAIRPKVIASTATVRKADEQVNNVFLRRVAIFPAHGLDVEDNFFSVQRTVIRKPGRKYVGICSPGTSRPAVLIRVYVALLTAAQGLFERFGQAADPYMTVVGYFNSLRELGGMRRLAEDDVQTRAFRVQMSDVARPGLSQRSVRYVDELTSRVSSKDIPKKLDQLEIRFKEQWAKGEARAIDIVLATNMLSVGVDVSRLGLMVVNGQPKNTAEYIQATSRVGRVFPGLVCTVLTWARPRDLSHYETFEHYHATFYKHVEAQSVTPFAPRALDRGLTGTMLSFMRLNNDPLNPNLGAQELTSTSKPEVAEAKNVLSERAWKVKDKAAGQRAEGMAADRLDRWVKEANRGGRRLGFEKVRGQGDIAALLKKPGALAWDEFTVPLSMREVEPGVQLVMDVAKLQEPPPWETRSTDTDGEGELQ